MVFPCIISTTLETDLYFYYLKKNTNKDVRACQREEKERVVRRWCMFRRHLVFNVILAHNVVLLIWLPYTLPSCFSFLILNCQQVRILLILLSEISTFFSVLPN